MIPIGARETGSLPDEAHNQVLRLLHDPFNMAQLIKANPDAFEAEPYAKILDRLRTILSEHAPAKVAEVLGQGNRHKAVAFTFLDAVDAKNEKLYVVKVTNSCVCHSKLRLSIPLEVINQSTGQVTHDGTDVLRRTRQLWPRVHLLNERRADARQRRGGRGGGVA